MPAKNLDDGKQPKDTSKGLGSMPHKALAASWQASADPNGKPDGTPGRTLSDSEFKAAVDLGKWAKQG